jgi:hypothetical protein
VFCQRAYPPNASGDDRNLAIKNLTILYPTLTETGNKKIDTFVISLLETNRF